MKLPRALATTAARGSGLARADVGAVTATGDAGFGAIARLGGDIRSAGSDVLAIQQHKQKISDDTQTDRIGQNIKLWSSAQEEALKTTRIETPQDQEKYLAGLTKGYNEMVTGEVKGMSGGVQRNVKSQSSRYFPAVHDQARRVSSAKFMEYTTVTELGIANTEAGAGDIEAANKRVNDLEAKGIIGPNKAAVAKNAIMESYKVGTINSFKPIIEQSLIANDFALSAANETIDKSVALMEKEGVLNKIEAAETRKGLSNWAADVAAQRKKVVNENLIQTYSGLADELAKGEFTGDSIILSGLSKTRIKEDGWAGIRAGARKDPPTVNTNAGATKVTDTLYDYSLGKIGKKEALLNVMQARFVDKGSITHDFYEKALGRIKTKYPDDVAKTIRGAMGDAGKILKHKGAGVFFGRDFIDPSEKTKLAEVEVGLFNWIEGESGDGTYPSGEEIYKKVRELGISVKTPESLKQNIPVKPPARNDITYDPSDADYDSLPSGTLIFDSVAGGYRRKP